VLNSFTSELMRVRIYPLNGVIDELFRISHLWMPVTNLLPCSQTSPRIAMGVTQEPLPQIFEMMPLTSVSSTGKLRPSPAQPGSSQTARGKDRGCLGNSMGEGSEMYVLTYKLP
jgi:hypothetical protein